MKGLNDAYVESIIKKSKDGKLPPGRRRQSSTKQYVNRLKKAYAEKGASAFGHGNKGKAKYEGFNFRHFLEKLNEEDLHHLQAPPPNSHRRRIQIAEDVNVNIHL